ncbi:rhodanese-like domain-containing protein [Bremerella sp. P1]|uniref:rhodanese-like domain-containing protein n=1 Tax=Bremerella sp. P1 TaxID=3026424 RepID=UPI002367E55C|nr:rhodanese-like domain-containing protein [Bremerella sp. P1]WDI45016.1 rhodanese-like domain-containing protein [Bremerella sp. P1]
MRKIILATTIAAAMGMFVVGTILTAEEDVTQLTSENPQIDYQGFLKQVQEVAKVREKRRISEDEFLRMMDDPETVVLDARSKRMYDLLHVKGAVHISLPDMTAEDLAKLIPEKDTQVVIYCNNNFKNEPMAFAPKAPVASLNLNTYNTLYSYGYRNIYELKPLLDRHNTKIPFGGTSAEKAK